MLIEEQNYQSFALNGNLKSIPCGILPSEKLSESDMKFLYTKFKNEGRSFYEVLRNNTFFKKCPYCEKRDVSELDHFLSQNSYPMFTIIPMNLVPSCHDCNTGKLDKNLEIIHPYFEDTRKEKWMICEIKVIFQVMVVSYKLSFKNTTFSSDTKKRIINTVNMFKLHVNYATWAASLISNKKGVWKSQIQKGGVFALVNLINEEYKSINSQMESDNSYKKVFYRSLINYLQQNSPDLSFLQ